jgi:SulP family sulfate permease
MNASLRRTKAPNYRSFPILDWFFGYQKEWLLCDLIAGLVTAAVVIPKAMAYATIAGLPVQVGLYTVLVPMAIYAMIGTSRALSVSTTTTLAILAASALNRVAVAGDPTSLMKASATLTLLVGAILLLAALLRLGFVANFISEPVLIGFKAGIAFVIVLDQIPKLLGVHITKGNFVHNLVATLQAVPHTSLPTLVVGIVMIVSLIGIARFFPRAPAPLIVVPSALPACACSACRTMVSKPSARFLRVCRPLRRRISHSSRNYGPGPWVSR